MTGLRFWGFWGRSLAAVLLLSSATVEIGGCGSERACPESSPVCGELTAPTEAPACNSSATSCEPSPFWGVVSGSRLKSRWWTDGEGAVRLAALHDTTTNIDCAYLSVGDATMCVPPLAMGQGSGSSRYYADANCTDALLTAQQAEQPYTTLGSGQFFGPPFEVYSAGEAVTTTSIYQGFFYIKMMGGGGGGIIMYACVPVTLAGARRAVVAPRGTFLEATQIYTTSTGRLAPAAWQGSDGSLVPVAANNVISLYDTRDSAFDAQRGEPCARALDRCLPTTLTRRLDGIGLAGSHPACIDADGHQQGEGTDNSYTVASCATAPFQRTVVAVASARDCTSDPSSCVCGDAPVVQIEPAEVFAHLVDARTPRRRLRAPTLTDGEGLCSPGTASLYDATLGVECWIEQTAIGARCVPSSSTSGIITQGFSDATCKTPLDATECESCRWAYDLSAAGEKRWFAVGALLSSSFYRLFEGVCIEQAPIYHALTAGAEGDFAAVTSVLR